MKKILLTVAMLLSAAAMQGAASSSSSVTPNRLRDLARNEFFKQLDIVRGAQPKLTDPGEIVSIAMAKMSKVPNSPEFEDPKILGQFKAMSSNKPLRDFLGLSIQDLIEHKLVPNAQHYWEDTKDQSTKLKLYLANMHIDDLTGIQNIPGIQTIQALHLNNNQLQALAPGALSGLTKLETLHLDNNKLQTLAPGVFSGLTNLETLRLNDNQLRAVAPGTVAGLTKLEWLFLNNNLINPTEKKRIKAELEATHPNLNLRSESQTPAK